MCGEDELEVLLPHRFLGGVILVEGSPSHRSVKGSESWVDGPLFGFREEGGAGRSSPSCTEKGASACAMLCAMLSCLIYLDLR